VSVVAELKNKADFDSVHTQLEAKIKSIEKQLTS